jgi:hypothetical protein
LKIGANIRSEHIANRLVEARDKRKNHSEDNVSALLAVPRYADVLDGGEGSENEEGSTQGPRSTLVHSAESWRQVMQKWIEEEREISERDPDTDQDTERRSKPWLPRSLSLLFGGKVAQPLGRRKRQPFDEEARMMELLAAEYEDEPPDDGEREGSGDDYSE